MLFFRLLPTLLARSPAGPLRYRSSDLRRILSRTALDRHEAFRETLSLFITHQCLPSSFICGLAKFRRRWDSSLVQIQTIQDGTGVPSYSGDVIMAAIQRASRTDFSPIVGCKIGTIDESDARHDDSRSSCDSQSCAIATHAETTTDNSQLKYDHGLQFYR